MKEAHEKETDPPLVLVVDDDTDHLILVQRWLIKAGYLVDGASHGRQALARIERQRPDLVITDLAMDEMDGLQLIEQIQLRDPLLPVIMVSGEADIPQALQAAHQGVVDFLVKPVKRDTLLEKVAETLARLGTAAAASEGPIAGCYVHRSTTSAELLQRARQAATGDAPILIDGPTGAGKQLLARCIHEASERREGPFVSIACGALPEQLLASELFGHVPGAFTGATERHQGLFQTASGGTLLLKDVDELTLDAQARLLQAIDQMQVQPLGASEPVPTDVRVIATTHVDLAAAVDAGHFREDLYYRLRVVPLHLPPLVERREDIPALVEHFLQQLGSDKRFSPAGLQLLVSADWPGNVRQLRNVVEHCQLMSPGEIIPENLVAEALEGLGSAPPTLDEARAAFERRYLAGLLRATNGNVTNAARLAGRNRTEFYKLLHRHELDPKQFRGGD